MTLIQGGSFPYLLCTSAFFKYNTIIYYYMSTDIFCIHKKKDNRKIFFQQEKTFQMSQIMHVQLPHPSNP